MLEQEQFVVREIDSIHIGRSDPAVPSGGEDNTVLPIGIHDNDGRAACRLGVYENARRIDMILLEIINQLGTKAVFPHASHYGYRSSLPGCGYRLVGAFAARDGQQVTSTDGFARPRKTRGTDDEIGIEGAYDDDIWHALILLDLILGWHAAD